MLAFYLLASKATKFRLKEKSSFEKNAEEGKYLNQKDNLLNTYAWNLLDHLVKLWCNDEQQHEVCVSEI